MTPPIAIAAVMPSCPIIPVAFNAIDATNNVAIVMPDTGLLLLPTRPTIREETVAKKNPNTITKNAPNKLIGITGISHIATANTITPMMITLMFKS